MIRFLDTVLDQSEEEKSLDHFKIEISNHGGTLQLDFMVKRREKYIEVLPSSGRHLNHFMVLGV